MQTIPQTDEAPVYGMRELIVEDCHGLHLGFGEDPGRAAQPLHRTAGFAGRR